MATPQQHVYTDPTVGMELTTGDEIALEATRWLFLAGDMLDPHRKEDLPHLAAGGEETGNVCLRRTNGYLPKCTFTPLEIWAEWLPIEFFPEGVRPLKLKGQPVEDQNPNGRTLIGKPLYGYAHYPGELIVDAIGLATGEKKGIVEIEVLRGVDYGDEKVATLQSDFFPDDYRPVKLREIRERIAAVAEKSELHRLAARDMLASCEQFERWATREIDKAHSQLDQRQSHMHVYSYSPKVRMLLEQLEIKPRQQQADISNELLKAVANSGVNLTALADRDENLISKLGQMFAESLATAMKSVQQPNQPPKK